MTPRLPKEIPFAEELGTLIGRTRRKVRMEVARRLLEQGSSVEAWTVLKHLVRSGPANQRELAEGTAQHASVISRLLVELESEGLVRRSRHTGDRRCQRVAVTARGRARFETGAPAALGAIEDSLGLLGMEEKQQLKRLLRKLLGDAPAVVLLHPARQALKR